MDAQLLHLATQDAIIDIPDTEALALYVLQLLQLCPQEGSIELRGQERGANVTPPVFIDHTPIELSTVGTFLPDDLGATDETFVIDDEHTTLTTVNVLRLVEGESTQMTNTTQGTTLVEGVDGMRRVLDDEEMMLLSQCHDGIHVTGNTGIMYYDDDLRALVDKWADGVNSDIGIVGTTISKHHFGTLTEKSDG